MLRGLQPRGVVVVGSVAGIQTRVQSGESMADEAIEHMSGNNIPIDLPNIKSPIVQGYGRVAWTRKQLAATRGRLRTEDGESRTEDK